MDIRTYRAESIQDALRMVRDDLGSAAIVLQTREVRAGGWLGLMGRKTCLEITASVDSSHEDCWPPRIGRMDYGIDLS